MKDGLDRPRIEVYNKVAGSFKEAYCFMPGNDDLKIIKRIGSQSVNGEVYLLETSNGGKLAGKIMPIVNEKTAKDNVEEMEIATKASNLVLSGETTHFPTILQTSTG